MSHDKLYQQIECHDREGFGTSIIVWVEKGRVKKGDIVTFKETGDKKWMVTFFYDTTITGVNRGWGLDLPKSQRTER